MFQKISPKINPAGAGFFLPHIYHLNQVINEYDGNHEGIKKSESNDRTHS